MHRGYTCVWRKIWSNQLLIEPGRRYSKLEAWLYIINVLAAGKDDERTGIKRGEFVASVRQLAGFFKWSRGAVGRFVDTLVQNSMITPVGHEAGQEAGHFRVCNYTTYNGSRDAERDTQRDTIKEVFKESINKTTKDTPAFAEAPAGKRVLAGRSFSEGRSPKILVEIYQQHNHALPEVKAVTAERLSKCRSRINQAVRDGCLEQYLADFIAAVQKAQQTPFLRGEGARGWRAGFDWFVANHVNIYAVLEGKYDGPPTGLYNANGGAHANHSGYAGPDGSIRRTSHGDPIYIPRQ